MCNVLCAFLLLIKAAVLKIIRQYSVNLGLQPGERLNN